MKHILRRLWKSYKPSSTHAPVLWHLDYQESSHSYESLPISEGEIGIFGTQNNVMQPSRWLRNHVEKKQRLTSERDWRQSNTVENINSPVGTSILGGRGGGGLGPHIKFGGKIWGKVRPSSPNKRKSLGSSVATRRKSWEKIPVLGSYLKFRGQNLGYLSLIYLEAKFGAPTRISEANFGVKAPPTT